MEKRRKAAEKNMVCRFFFICPLFFYSMLFLFLGKKTGRRAANNMGFDEAKKNMAQKNEADFLTMRKICSFLRLQSFG